MRLQLEDLREFLQEQLADSYLLPDDVVVEHLQTAMSELRSKKLDQPPPGAAVFHCLYFLLYQESHITLSDQLRFIALL